MATSTYPWALGLNISITRSSQSSTGLVVPQSQAYSTAHLSLALLGDGAEVVHQALHDQSISAQLGLLLLAESLNIRLAVGGHANIEPVTNHTPLVTIPTI